MPKKTIGSIYELYQDPETWTGEANLHSKVTTNPSEMLHAISESMNQATSSMLKELLKEDPLVTYLKKKGVSHTSKSKPIQENFIYKKLVDSETGKDLVADKYAPEVVYFLNNGWMKQASSHQSTTQFYVHGYLDHKGQYHAPGWGPMITDGHVNQAVSATELEDLLKNGLIP